MSEPVTWQILQRVLPRLVAIRIANGYATDAGAHATCEPPPPNADDDSTRVVLVEESSRIDSHKPAAINTTSVILAEGAISAALGDAQRIAHALRADITRALARVTASDFAGLVGGTVTRFELSSDRPILRPQDGNEFVVVQVRASVACVEYIPPAPGSNQ